MNESARKERLLIVDDVPANIRVLTASLGADYEVNVATNGEDAVRIANSEQPPDLILLDIMMPGMDGYEVCRTLKSNQVTQGIPIIFISAKSEEEAETKGLQVGAVDYITKPFRLPIVRARVRSQLDRKRMEEAQRQVERLSAIADLASGVAHHFNNMLQVVMGGASVALIKMEHGDLEDAKSMIRQIVETSRFGAETVKRLQDFVRMQRGEAGPDRVFDLSRTASQAIETSRHWWEKEPHQEGMDIRLVASLTDGCFVKGRESELFEVVTNLIRNAVEAMPQGGELRVATGMDDDKVFLEVKDTGVGIAKDYLPRVLEPFFTTKGFQRVGMGLASVYGIVKSHGGAISVEGEPGRGATFRVVLSVATASPAVAEDAATPAFGSRLRVLVIDDVQPITTMISDLFGELGHDAIISLSGEDGLRAFEEQPVDLVICDLGMPRISGWEVGKRIKQICEAKGKEKVPFVLLTGWGGQLKHEAKIAECGVDVILEKPLDTVKLLSVVRELAEGRSRAV